MNFSRFALLALICVPQTAVCGSTEIKWTEEVRLHDGTVVQVKRRTEITASGFPTQRRGLRKFHELCYAPLNVYWKSRPHYPLEAFDIIDGRIYVKASVHGCNRCKYHGYPETDAIYFVWVNQGWQQVHESQAPLQLKFNLLAAEYGGDPAKDARGLVTLAEKQRREGSIYTEMEYTGRKSPYEPGACAKCRSVSVPADSRPVFIDSNETTCKW